MKTSVKRAIEDDAAAVVSALLESHFWLPSLGVMTAYLRHEDAQPLKRLEDDSPTGSIQVVFTQDGDGWMQIIATPDPEDFHTTFRFRMPMIGGGQSPRTRVALLILAEAIRLDNEENPQHRGG